MKKIFLGLLIIFAIPLYCYAIEEVTPPKENEVIELQLDENQEKLHFEPVKPEKKVYFDEHDKLKLHMDGYFINEVKIGAVYNGTLDINFLHRPAQTEIEYDIPYMDTWIEGKFKDNKTSFKINVNPVRHVPKRNYMATLWQDIWLKHDFNENQSIQAGYYRTPNGEEGSISSYVQDFASRSQIARTFANARATGVKNSGRYKYVDYDIGVFDSARYFDTFFQGAEFIGKVSVKPLEFADGKYGHLKIGGSINSGKRKSSYTVVNAFIGYKYKKFSVDAEYAHADGYNGAVNYSGNKAQGFYTTLKYEVTPKVHLLARYDLFDPNTTVSGNNIEEYSVGINYYPLGRFVKLCFNYVFRQNHAETSSNRLVFLTQFSL